MYNVFLDSPTSIYLFWSPTILIAFNKRKCREQEDKSMEELETDCSRRTTFVMEA